MRRKRTMYRKTLTEKEMGEFMMILREDEVGWTVASDRIQFYIGPYTVTTASVCDRFDLGKRQMQRFIAFLLRQEWS